MAGFGLSRSTMCRCASAIENVSDFWCIAVDICGRMLTRCCFLVLPATGGFPAPDKTMHYHRNRHYCTCFLSGIGDLFDKLRVELVILPLQSHLWTPSSMRELRSDLTPQRTPASNIAHSCTFSDDTTRNTVLPQIRTQYVRGMR